MYVEQETLPGACGVSLLSNFGNYAVAWKNHISAIVPTGGCGYISAGFVADDEESKKVYNGLCKKYGEPEFCTETRTNRNSGNSFFFAIWDVTKTTDKYGLAYYGEDDDD